MHLGVKMVIASSIERIHAANLVNFGIVPLLFTNAADYEKLSDGDSIQVKDIVAQLKPNETVMAKLADGTAIELNHTLSDDDIQILKAGGRLNV